MAALTEAQRELLNDYLLEKRSLIAQTKPFATEVAGWCREVLKFTVDVGNVTHRVGPAGKLWEWDWPQTEQTKKGRAKLSDINLVLEQVYALHAWASGVYHALANSGITIAPPARLEGLMERVKKAREELAIADQREPEEQ